jgi:hypothetical protein
MVEREFIPEMAILKLVSGYIALTEITSMFENLYYITNLKLWKTINNRLRPVLGLQEQQTRLHKAKSRKPRKG